MTATLHSLEDSLADISDFPDRVQPLVVKELRRGLRSMFFVLPFAVLPAMLGLVGLWVLAQADHAGARAALSSGLWFAVVIPLYGLKPIQALQVVRRERAARSLDLLLLSRLTPLRIILGKWASLEAQSLLYLASILPFFVLSHFLGRIELVAVGFALVLNVVWTSFLTVICLTISTFRRTAFWIHTALLFVFTPLLLLPATFLGTVLEGGAGGFHPVLFLPLLLGALVLGVVAFFALAIAASNLGALPTSRYARAAAAQKLAAESAGLKLPSSL